MFERIRNAAVTLLGILLCLFTLVEVNFAVLQTQSELAVFVMLGLVICFLVYPLHPKLKDNKLFQGVDVLLALGVVACCGYVVIQTEPFFNDLPTWFPVPDFLLTASEKLVSPEQRSVWSAGQSIAERAGIETTTDFAIGLAGMVLVLEATRRSIGWIVPALAICFVLHSFYCYASIAYELPAFPNWMLPHAGQNMKDIASTSFLQTTGVFGTAARVMLRYVFLFVVFGAFLEMSGATQFIIDFAERIFGGSPGGPAKISVLGSGLMGSLSGSAVANAVTTGAFTIPMMRNAGFDAKTAAGITAAAAAGGALVPPVMGAGAYMMLELVEPQVTFLQIAKAALIPAALYYLSIFMIVHFYSRRIRVGAVDMSEKEQRPLWVFEALVFFGALTTLVGMLALHFTPFKAVSGALVVILVLSTVRKKLALGMYPRILALTTFFGVMLLHQLLSPVLKASLPTLLHPYLATAWVSPNTGAVSAMLTFQSLLGSSIMGMLGLLIFGLINPVWRPTVLEAMTKSAKNGIALVAASACVGIIIGVVQQTGVAGDFSAVIKGVVETSLLLALLGIMACSIVLGMGVPSVVCYLLMATLMGSLLSQLGVLPLAAHFFIFYFGMMSMVTPPVALAAYASASIAGSRIMPTAFAAFRFSLVGFTLPFMFVYRPELLLMSDKPEVVVSLARPKEVKADEPAAVSGRLIWAGEPVADTGLTLTPVDRSADGPQSKQTLKTDAFGEVRFEIQPGQYTLAVTADDEKQIHLGMVLFDPKSSVTADSAGSKKSVDQRLVFVDQRLSIVAVLLAVFAATLGIFALASGIAGFLFSRLRVWVCVTMFVAAALLLSPDITLAGQEFGLYANIAGGVLFVVMAAINKLGATSQSSTDLPSEPNTVQ